MQSLSFEKLAEKKESEIESLLDHYSELSAKYMISYRTYRNAREGTLDPDVWHPLAIKASTIKKELDSLKKEINKLRRKKKESRTKSTRVLSESIALQEMAEEAINFMRDRKKIILSPELSKKIIRLAEKEGLSRRPHIMRTRNELKSETIHCVISRDNRPINLELTDKNLSNSSSLPTNFGVSLAFRHIASAYTALLINKDNIELKRIKTFDVEEMDSILVRKDILKQLKVPEAPFIYVTESLAKVLKTRLKFVRKVDDSLPPIIEGSDRVLIEKINTVVSSITKEAVCVK